MKVLRSTLVAAVAFVAAACGDKVTVTEQGPDTTVKVLSVTVSPANVVMNIGQSVTFTAVVDVQNGAATGVTWSPTSGAVSVSAAGVATANSATPGVAVCATSSADPNKKGCAQAVVSAAPVTIPATVSIQSITISGTAGTTVVPTAVAGGIDVRVNVSPGTQTVSKVVLLVGATRADSQTFTAAQSAALRFAAEEAMANQSAFPPIMFAVNTAAFSTVTGIPTYLNGTYTISAQLYTAGATSASATATAQTPLTFANANGWWATLATSGTTANGLNAGGFRYDRGSLTVGVLPVIYTSGVTVATGTVSFGSAACDSWATVPPVPAPAFAGGARTTALAAAVAPAVGWTATFAGTGAVAVGNVSGYEFNGCAALNAIGETPTVTAVNSNGDALFTAAAPLNVVALTGIRLDNRAPQNPAGSTNAGNGLIKLNLNPNGRASNWLNDAVTFNGTAVTTAASNNYLCVGAAVGACLVADTLPRDNGIATGTTYYLKAAATKAAATTAAGITNTTTLNAGTAGSATFTSWCGIAYAADALGNETASPSTATACGAEVNNTTFGVDRAAPTIAYCDVVAGPCAALSLASNARLSGGTVGGEFIVAVNDTGLVGNSGMLPTFVAPNGPVRMLLSRRAAGATGNSAGTTTTFNGNGATAAAAQTSAGTLPLAASATHTTSFTAITGAANHAYWTHSSTAYDAAGNTTALASRVVVYDATAPAPGTPSAPLTIAATGFTTAALINEDLDIQDYSFGTTYGAMVLAPKVIQQAVVPVNGYNAATFSNTNFTVSTTVNLPLAIQANVAAGLAPITGITTTSRAQSNLAATSGAFAPLVVTPGAGIGLQAGAFTGFPAPTAPATIVGVTSGAGPLVANATNPASTTITATAVGATATFTNPFARVDFYMLNAAGTQWFLVGSTTAATLNDNGVTRTYSYPFTLTGAAAYAAINGSVAALPIASSILVIGMNANGNVGMEPAALLGFAIR
jgi:hypothetical protein